MSSLDSAWHPSLHRDRFRDVRLFPEDLLHIHDRLHPVWELAKKNRQLAEHNEITALSAELWWQAVRTEPVAIYDFSWVRTVTQDGVGEWSHQGHAPKPARIDWVILEGSELKQWRERFGDREPKLPAALKRPDWWRKEFGEFKDRWEWDPTWGSVLPRRGDVKPASIRPAVEVNRLMPNRGPVEGYSSVGLCGELASITRKELRERLADREVPISIHDSWIYRRDSRNNEPDLNTNVLEQMGAAMEVFSNELDKSGNFKRKELPRYQRYMRVGVFGGAASSSVVAHSTRWMGDPHTGDVKIPAKLRLRREMDHRGETTWRIHRETWTEADYAVWKSETSFFTQAQYESWKRKHWTWDDSLDRHVEEWANRRRISTDDTQTLDYHDRTTLAVDAEEPMDDAPPPALAAKFKAHAADLQAARDEHIAVVNADERAIQKHPIEYSSSGTFPKGPAAIVEWTAKPSKAVLKFWNALLRDEAKRLSDSFKQDAEVGLMHTGFENLGNEELRSLKYKKSKAIPRYKNELVADLDKEEQEEDDEAEELPDEDAVPDEDQAVSDVEEVEPEDDKMDDDNEEPEGFSEPESETSDGTSYSNDLRFVDDEDAIGRPEGHDHLEPMYEDATTRETDPLDHDDLQGVRDLIDAKAQAGEYRRPRDPAEATIKRNGIEVNKLNKEFQSDSFIVEWIMTNATKDRTQEGEERWLAQAAARLQTTMDALYRRRQELLKRSRAMRSQGGSQVPDEPKLTYAQAVDIADRDATYIKLKLYREWEWHKLDVDKHGSVVEAIEALRQAKEKDALRKHQVLAKTKPKRKKGDALAAIDAKEERAKAIAEVKDRYDKVFHIDRMQIAPARREGLIGLIARFGGVK